MTGDEWRSVNGAGQPSWQPMQTGFVSKVGTDTCTCTIALTGGVPLELVQKVTGHKTPREEMRELIAIVRPVALRERLLKVWAKW